MAEIPPRRDLDYVRCGQCGDELLPEEIEGHLNSEGRTTGLIDGVVLSVDEMEVMRHVNAARQAIIDWGLLHNGTELTMYVHGIQGFIVQHMLQRLDPEHWAKWYENPA